MGCRSFPWQSCVGKPLAGAHICQSILWQINHTSAETFRIILLKTDYVSFNHSFNPDIKAPCVLQDPLQQLCRLVTQMSSRQQGLERLQSKALWAPAGTADLILLRKGQTSGPSPEELHHILHVESQETWPGSGLDMPAEDNSIQSSMARPGKLFLAGTAGKLSSGPFQQALIWRSKLNCQKYLFLLLDDQPLHQAVLSAFLLLLLESCQLLHHYKIIK